MNGLDLLGLGSKHWNMKDTVKVWPQGWALGCFDGTTGDSKFGDARANVTTLLKTGKVPAVRIQLFYSTAHSFCPDSVLKDRLPKWEKLAQAFPAVTFYCSPSTEHNLKDAKALAKVFDTMRKLAPHITPVNNPWQGTQVSSVLHETHNPKIRSDIFSDDGSSCTDNDVAAVNRVHGKDAIRFYWASRFNLREQYDSGKLPPPETRTAVPDAHYLKAIIRLADDKGVPPAPKFKGVFVAIKRPMLWKCFAEDKAGYDVRANKPLLISPETATLLSVVDCNGKEVAKLRLFGNYPPNLHRHYSGTGSNLWGYQIADKAKKQSGSPFVWITANKKTYYGPINPAFRTGYF